ncbi:homeobox protein engrailed-like [Plakobranchus ocellatus]|uniref:Homeobox protein engrailed-like n=1 Tax=Plakobranchus ocellatus TaxID=259542 RepID=A0AAV3ZAW1_9GAST|nr:homeobox protein engrailed-like [Plakobranchus ocellatus]
MTDAVIQNPNEHEESNSAISNGSRGPNPSTSEAVTSSQNLFNEAASSVPSDLPIPIPLDQTKKRNKKEDELPTKRSNKRTAIDESSSSGISTSSEGEQKSNGLNSRDFTTKKKSETATSAVTDLCAHSEVEGQHVCIKFSPSSLGSSDSVDSDHFNETKKENNGDVRKNIDLNPNKNDRTKTVKPATAKIFSIASLLGEPVDKQPHKRVQKISESCHLDLKEEAFRGSNSNKENDSQEGELIIDESCNHQSQCGSQGRKRQRSSSSDRWNEPKSSRSFICNSREDAEEETGVGCESAKSPCPETGDSQEQSKTKRKLKRTQYSKSDLRILNAYFNENNWLSPVKQEALAKEMGYTDTQIKTWFQNKRASIYGTRRPKGRNKNQATTWGQLNFSAGVKGQHCYQEYPPNVSSQNILKAHTLEVSALPNKGTMQSSNGSALPARIYLKTASNNFASNNYPNTTCNFTVDHAPQRFSGSLVNPAQDNLFPRPPNRALNFSTDSAQSPQQLNSNSPLPNNTIPEMNSQIHVSGQNGTVVNAEPIVASGASSSHSTYEGSKKPRELHENVNPNEISSLRHQQHVTKGFISTCVESHRQRPFDPSIDYTRPENNPFIATFLNLTGWQWNSPRFSPLVKPHLPPRCFLL